MNDLALLAASKLSRARSLICCLTLAGVLAIKFSSLTFWESLTAYNIAVVAVLAASITIVTLSIKLARQSRTARAQSIAIAVVATLCCALPVAMIYFAQLGHGDLVFENHVLIVPEHARWRLGYFNVPLGFTYMADILLLALCSMVSAASTSALKRAAAQHQVNC
ncbi:hypothetical protein ACFYV7_28880 [Nocardia suismassiliense]|uniref:Integral membrane protein n=1 Tax=Nocardia suismassiliense TaxID=2077092 RepID=A0ABW6QZZ6_9NOCA